MDRLKKRCTAYMKATKKRKEALKQYEAFCQWLLKNKRCSKQEIRQFFKRISDVKEQ